MLVIDQSGWVVDPLVEKYPCPSIDRGELPATVAALVIHQTGGSTALGALTAWRNKPEGAHFLISESGKIFQTVSVKRQCWHVGTLRSRCQELRECTKEDFDTVSAFVEKIRRKNNPLKLLSDFEKSKAYPLRYPRNTDSLGIEVVGKAVRFQDPATKKDVSRYPAPASVQQDSLNWLLNGLMACFAVTLQDLYAHGLVARKDSQKSEGVDALHHFRLTRQ